MPAPYTDAEQDAMLDDHEARIAALETDVADLQSRVSDIEATLAIIEPAFATAQSDIAALQTDSASHGSNISNLQTDVLDIDGRVIALENATVPAVDTLQGDVATLTVASRQRQENDQTAIAKPTPVLRPSIQRVLRPDGKPVQRVVRPR